MQLPALIGALALAQAPSPDVLIWTGGNDYYTLTVRADGTATYQVHSGGFGLPAQAPPPRQAKLRKGELKQLEALLVQHKIFQVIMPRRTYLPEERNDVLTAHFAGLEGTISLPSNDWRKNPDARACSAALDALAQRVSHGKVASVPDGGTDGSAPR